MNLLFYYYVLMMFFDVLLTGSNPMLLTNFILAFDHESYMKDLGLLHYFLGIEVIHTTNGILLSQKKYALDILDHAQMKNCQPMPTHMN